MRERRKHDPHAPYEHHCCRCERLFFSMSTVPDYCSLCMSAFWDRPPKMTGARARKAKEVYE